MALCTDLIQVEKFVRSALPDEAALLSFHILFNFLCYLGVVKINLTSDCRDMQVEAAVYEVRPCHFTDKKGNLAKL